MLSLDCQSSYGYRESSTMFLESTDAPKTKKKKSRAKDSPLLSAHAQSPPLEATPTPTQAAVTAKTSTKSKRGSPSKATKTAEAPRESESPIVQEPSPTASPSAGRFTSLLGCSYM